jgi:hypothetical protein
MVIESIECKESRKEWMTWMFKRAGAANSTNKVYQFWQQDNHPIKLSTNEMMNQRLSYLHKNLVRAGIVCFASHYKYSSAVDYYEERAGLLKVELL